MLDKNKIFLIAVIGVLFVVSTLMFSFDGNKKVIQNDDGQNQNNESKSDVISGEDNQIVPDETKEITLEEQEAVDKGLLEDNVQNQGGKFFENYSDFDGENYSKKILFFTAQWCPSCVEIEKTLQKNEKNIPSGVAIVIADFDDEQLREKYNIKKQSTFVLLDNNDAEIKRWYNSTAFDEVLNNLK